MWRVKTNSKFKNSFFPVLIYWSDNRIHSGFENSGLSPPPIIRSIKVVSDNIATLKHFCCYDSNLSSLFCELCAPLSTIMHSEQLQTNEQFTAYNRSYSQILPLSCLCDVAMFPFQDALICECFKYWDSFIWTMKHFPSSKFNSTSLKLNKN